MNEQLEQALTGLITRSLEGIDAATGFLAAEIPDVVAQLLMWHGVYSLVVCISSLVFVVLTWFFWIKKLMPKLANYERRTDPNAAATYIVGNLCVFLITLPFVVKGVNMQWLKIWIAPKVWLLEYAANLTK